MPPFGHALINDNVDVVSWLLEEEFVPVDHHFNFGPVWVVVCVTYLV